MKQIEKENKPAPKTTQNEGNEKKNILMLHGHDCRHNSIYSNDLVNAQTRSKPAPKAKERVFFSFSLCISIRSLVCHIFIFFSCYFFFIRQAHPSFVIINGISMLMLSYFLNDIQTTHAHNIFPVLSVRLILFSERSWFFSYDMLLCMLAHFPIVTV